MAENNGNKLYSLTMKQIFAKTQLKNAMLKVNMDYWGRNWFIFFDLFSSLLLEMPEDIKRQLLKINSRLMRGFGKFSVLA